LCETHDMPYFGRLVPGLSPRGPGFDPKSVYVGFMADIMALGQVFLIIQVRNPLSTIPKSGNLWKPKVWTHTTHYNHRT